VLTDIRRGPGSDPGSRNGPESADAGDGGLITITYWDYGGKSLRQVSEAFLKKIVYGVVHCTRVDDPELMDSKTRKEK
jgi:hypothetical protein